MIRLLPGDCRDVLATLPADSVQCVVTSPPYYGLRDYGTAQWDGGDAACDHRLHVPQGAASSSTLRPEGQPHHHMANAEVSGLPFRATCGKCGATRVDRQIGLEATPDEYLATMVGVFREVRRVLRPDGTCWVNMGDSYAGAGYSNHENTGGAQRLDGGKQRHSYGVSLAAKQLLLMPARLALALQADGWWVRSDIIWHKPNPMPESCRDRPTSAHEHVFLLTKAARYYYDAAAIAEPSVYPDDDRKGRQRAEDYQSRAVSDRIATLNPSNPQTYPMRSCRNVWTIATAPFPGSHFATMPAAVVERCIRAGTSERGCCSQCSKPWVRATERGDLVPTRKNYDLRAYGVVVEAPDAMDQGRNRARDGHRANMAYETTTTGWRAGCDHAAPVSPCVVLDPFAGAGTTLLCADRLQRDAIGIELNTAYTEMAMQRCRDDAPLFVDAPAADPEDERMADLFAEAAE